METDMIKITHLKKSFGDVKAVNDLSFHDKNFDYPEKPLKYKHIRRISD